MYGVSVSEHNYFSNYSVVLQFYFLQTVLEGFVRDLKKLFVEHLGYLAQSPAFPEVCHPILVNVKRFGKTAKNKVIRKEFSQLAQEIETTAAENRLLRDKSIIRFLPKSSSSHLHASFHVTPGASLTHV